MAKKDSKAEKEQAKEKEEGTASKEKAAAPADENAPVKKKKKLVLFAGIGAIALAALGGGGFFVMKTLGGKKQDLAAQKLDSEKTEGGSSHPDEDATENKEKPSGEQKSKHSGDQKEETASEKKEEHSGDKKEEPAGSKKEEHTGDKKSPPTEDPSKADANGKEGSHPAPKADSEENSFGETFNLPRMELNLGNPLENRFLKVGISLEFHGGEEQEKALEKRLPQIKDLVITLIAQKTRMELLTPLGKETFRKQLKNTFNEVLEKPITNVYFTEFLVE